jgi:hypothetical protein
MFKITTDKVKELFDAIDLDYIIETDKVKTTTVYEDAVKIGTVSIDLTVNVILDHHDNGIDFDKLILDIKVFDEGEEIPYKLVSQNDFLNMFDRLEAEIKGRL